MSVSSGRIQAKTPETRQEAWHEEVFEILRWWKILAYNNYIEVLLLYWGYIVFEASQWDYINDEDEDIISKISEFADDTKLCGESGSETEAKILPEDLNRPFRSDYISVQSL